MNVNKLIEWREENLVSQAELAQRLGVSVATVSLWERGISEPYKANFRKLEKETGIRFDK